MKLNLTLTIMPNGDQAIKGEELREEITTQCEQMQIDGWKVADVKLTEGKEHNIGQDILSMVQELRRICFKPPADKWDSNPEHTNESMADYWLAEITRMTKGKAKIPATTER